MSGFSLLVFGLWLLCRCFQVKISLFSLHLKLSRMRIVNSFVQLQVPKVQPRAVEGVENCHQRQVGGDAPPGTESYKNLSQKCFQKRVSKRFSKRGGDASQRDLQFFSPKFTHIAWIALSCLVQASSRI